MKQMFLLLVTLAFAAAGWTDEEKKEEKPEAPADRGKTIWLITKGARESCWKTARAGALKAAKELGVKINWQAPLNETDVTKQTKLVDDAIAAHADGILLAPITEGGLAPAIDRAVAANIPVVIFDSPAKTEKPVASILGDYAKGGELAARRLGEALSGKGKVIMVRGSPDNPATMARENAFKQTLAKEFPDIKLTDNYGGNDRQKSTEVCEEMLKAYGDPDGLFASNEAAAFGALGALANRGITDKVKVIACDASPKLVEALATGKLDALLVHSPFQMGYKGVQALVNSWDGKSVDKRTDTAVELATKDNMNDASAKELLAPQ